MNSSYSFKPMIEAYKLILLVCHAQESLFGWSVDNFQMVGRSPLPDDVMAGLDWSDSGNIPIVYGQVFLLMPPVSKQFYRPESRGCNNKC